MQPSPAYDRRILCWCVGLSLFVVANRGVSGQERESWGCFRSSAESLSLHSEDPWTIRKRVTEVTLSFTARDRHGFVPELAPADVHVTEDGRPIVRMWAFQNQRDLPLRLGLLIDTSGSVNPHFRFAQESAIQFLRSMVRPHWDLAFVMGFSDHLRYTTDFSDDIDSLAVGVSSLENRGGTALFDAIQQAATNWRPYPTSNRSPAR